MKTLLLPKRKGSPTLHATAFDKQMKHTGINNKQKDDFTVMSTISQSHSFTRTNTWRRLLPETYGARE